ncbi:MAG: site-specific integrase [Gammaproteobacteria bacterium]|nr:MAG: site-specific integrase [Gammaproteobacteria bacterium]
MTPGRITECKKKLLTGVTYRKTRRNPATVNRYLAALSVCLNYAVKDLGWLEDSPLRKVRKSREARGRIRFLSDDETINGEVVAGERTRLLKACKETSNPNLYLVVLLALSTGMRQGEIMNLTWDNADLKRGRITLYNTKNNEIRVVPLSGKALELLTEHAKVRHIDTNLLFPSKSKKNAPMDLRAPWEAALKTAQIKDFRFHDLSHSCASYLAINGATASEIAEVLGHKTLQMVKRYAHLSDDHLEDALSSMKARFM